MAVAERHNILKFDADGKILLEKILGVHIDVVIKNFHIWGCPVYVIDSRIQDGNRKLPKWYPRSRDGIYFGQSTVHANSVALVMNPKTGHVSPQFHLVFDDEFTTISHKRNVTVTSNWYDLVDQSLEGIFLEHFFSPQHLAESRPASNSHNKCAAISGAPTFGQPQT